MKPTTSQKTREFKEKERKIRKRNEEKERNKEVSV